MQAPVDDATPSGEQLTVQVGTSPTRAYVRLVGELDIATAPLLAALVDELVQDGRREMNVDLDGLTFVDACGLAALAAAHALCWDRHARLTVTGGRPLTRQLLTMTGLDQLLTLR